MCKYCSTMYIPEREEDNRLNLQAGVEFMLLWSVGEVVYIILKCFASNCYPQCENSAVVICKYLR